MEVAVIRVNDRQDPQQGSTVLAGAEVVSSEGMDRVFLTPSNEFTARLAQSPIGERFLVAIGDPEAPEGEAPDVWYGVATGWQPAGSKVRVTARPARAVEEMVH
jgi:hypothetical protein